MKFAYFNPTVLAVEDVPQDVFIQIKDMVDIAHQKKEFDDSNTLGISIRGGQQIQLLPSDYDLNIDFLKSYIEKICSSYLDTVLKINGGTDIIPYVPQLVSAWTIKQNSGDYQAIHSHEAHISGNIYIETPELKPESKSSDSCLEFRLPVVRNPAQFVFTDNWKFKPEIGKMVIFPSYIPHTVYPWKGSGNRTILAWDVKLHQIG